MILCFIFLTLALVALIILMFIRLINEDVGIIEFVLHCLATVMVFCALTVYGCYPKAMDVYRNKTTLEITYQDSIPVDSVVIFKNK